MQATLKVSTFNLDPTTIFVGIGLFGQTLKELFMHGRYNQ